MHYAEGRTFSFIGRNLICIIINSTLDRVNGNSGHRERERKIWQLYQEGNSFVKIGKKLRRSPDTVSRYVHEYEAAVGAASVMLCAVANKGEEKL